MDRLVYYTGLKIIAAEHLFNIGMIGYIIHALVAAVDDTVLNIFKSDEVST